MQLTRAVAMALENTVAGCTLCVESSHACTFLAVKTALAAGVEGSLIIQ